MAGRLRRGASIADISATAMNRLLELQKDGIGGQPGKASSKQPFTKVLGRNDCGYALKPGAPVRLDTFYSEESAYSGYRRGWFSLKPLSLPTTTTAVWTQPGIALDGCANGELVNVAIDGVVEAAVQNGGAGTWVCPLVSSDISHREQLQSSTVGFAQSLAVCGQGYQLIRFGPTRWEVFYKITQVTPRLVTLYHVHGSPLATNVEILDSHSIAQWQVIDDVGWADLFYGQWVIKVPICRDV